MSENRKRLRLRLDVSQPFFVAFLFNCIRRRIAHPHRIASPAGTMQLWAYVAFCGVNLFLARSFGLQPSPPFIFSDCLCTPFYHQAAFCPLLSLSPLSHFLCNQIGARPVESCRPPPLFRTQPCGATQAVGLRGKAIQALETGVIV